MNRVCGYLGHQTLVELCERSNPYFVVGGAVTGTLLTAFVISKLRSTPKTVSLKEGSLDARTLDARVSARNSASAESVEGSPRADEEEASDSEGLQSDARRKSSLNMQFWDSQVVSIMKDPKIKKNVLDQINDMLDFYAKNHLDDNFKRAAEKKFDHLDPDTRTFWITEVVNLAVSLLPVEDFNREEAGLIESALYTKAGLVTVFLKVLDPIVLDVPHNGKLLTFNIPDLYQQSLLECKKKLIN